MNRKARRSSQQKNKRLPGIKKKSQQPEQLFNAPSSPLIEQALQHAVKLREAGKLFEARGAFEAVTQEDPTNACAFYNLGLMALTNKDIAVADTYFEKARKLEPTNTLILSAASVVKCDLGDTDKAFEYIDTALETAPHDPNNHHRKARIYQIQGNFENALECLRQSVTDDPFFILGWVALAELKKFKEGDAELKQMISIDKKTKHRDASERSHIKFAIAKALYDCKDFNKSFDYYKDANKLRDSMLPPNPQFKENLDNDIHDLKECFTPEIIEKFKDCGHKSEKPIFIVGMPRSGTTLVEQIIASHPDTFGAGEINDFNKSFDIPKTPAKPVAGKGAFYNKVRPLLTNDQILQGGQNYVDLINSLAPDAKRVIDKLPFNYMWVALMRLALPNAKIIQCARNPMDTGLSIYRQNFSSLFPWTWDLGKIGHVYNSYDDLMNYWHELFPGQIYVAQYEKIIENQEEESRKLIEFCDLPWDDACLEFHKAKKEVRTASIYQVRQPIYKSSLKGWQRFEEQLDPLYQVVKQHMK